MSLARAIAAIETLLPDELDIVARVVEMYLAREGAEPVREEEPRATVAAGRGRRRRSSSADRMAKKRALARERKSDAQSVTSAVTSDAGPVTSDAGSDAESVTSDANRASHRVTRSVTSRPSSRASEPSEISDFLDLKIGSEKRESRRAREGVTLDVTQGVTPDDVTRHSSQHVTLASAVTRDQQRVTEVRSLVSAAYRQRRLGVPAALTDLTGTRGVSFATWAQEQDPSLLREQLEAFFADDAMRSKGWPFAFFMSNPGESLARSKRAASRASNMLRLTDDEDREGARAFLRAGAAHDPRQLAEYEAQWAREDAERQAAQ